MAKVKKTKTKAATKKAVKKSAPKKAAATKPRLARGYKITKVIRELNLPAELGGKDDYELYEVTSAKMDKPRVFITEETARQFVQKMEKLEAEFKALAGKGHAPVGMRDVVRGTADIAASAELADVGSGPKSDRKESKVMYSDSE